MTLSKSALPLALLLCSAASLWVRTVPIADVVLHDDQVLFQGTDPWYHVRLIENTVHNFPHRIAYDPYAIAPDGHDVPVAPLFDQLVAAAALAVGLGNPDGRQIQLVAAVAPAVLGTLLVLPVYMIGRIAFDRLAGLLAAGLVAILPGTLLARTSLGYVDHHAAESLFSALVLMFLLFSLKAAAREEPTLEGWRSARATVAYSVLCGVSLAAYLLTWVGGSVLVLLLLTWLVTQFAADRFLGRSTDYLLFVAVPCMLVALLGVLPWWGSFAYLDLQVWGLVACLLALPVLGGLSRFAARRGWSGLRFAIGVVLIGAIATGLFYVALPGGFAAATGLFSRFLGPVTDLGIEEVQSPLAPIRARPLELLWEEFATAGLLAIAGLFLLGRSVVRTWEPRATAVLVWSLLMGAATLVQLRFAYYSALNVALLSALLCGALLSRANARRGRSPGHRRLRIAVTCVAVFFLAYFPSLLEARTQAPGFTGPTEEWIDVLRWLREKTPRPVSWEDAYRARYSKPAAGRRPAHVPPMYAIMNWWDYGYWILVAGRRVPTSNPTQAGADRAARFYLAQDEREASSLLDGLAVKYVVVDSTLPMLTPTASGGVSGKFRGLAAWAGRDYEQFFERYAVRRANGEMAVQTLFYPTYYRSMCVRLYLYEGAAVEAKDSSYVIRWQERLDDTGGPTKQLIGSERFSTYAEARAFVEAQPDPDHYRIVSDDPTVSCVPLEALQHYRLVHASPGVMAQRGTRKVAFVEVFEYDE